MARSERLQPIIKWAGGKERELKYILPQLPKQFERYIEPFTGGGAVFFAIDSSQMFINDRSEELIALYNAIKKGDSEFFSKLEQINHHWTLIEQVVENNHEELLDIYKKFSSGSVSLHTLGNLVVNLVIQHHKEFKSLMLPDFNVDILNFIQEIRRNFTNKVNRTKKIEMSTAQFSDQELMDNIETAFKSAFYMHFRYLYNQIRQDEVANSDSVAIFYFIREFCYASMFRYNKSGGFNVPYGGMQYNRKDFLKKIKHLQSLEYRTHLAKAKVSCLDFGHFLRKIRPNERDFIFLDPPYDSDFSSYAGHSFTKDDHIRLARFLTQECPAMFMLIIKNTDFIRGIYSNSKLLTTSFDKKYLVSFQDRNNKDAEHLMITNYAV